MTTVTSDYQSHESAATWFELAAQQGHLDAQVELGKTYWKGTY